MRKRNGGVLDSETYHEARRLLNSDAFAARLLQVADVTYDDVLEGIALIERHNINSSDAAILARYIRLTSSDYDRAVLVASDHRLLRAAQAERLHTINPENTTPGGLPGQLARIF